MPSALAILLVLALAVHAEGQVPFDTCRDRADRPIPGIVDNTIAYAGTATFRNGQPVILWNRKTNRHLSPTEQLFIYLHECAHHTLGHLYHPSPDVQQELEADCWSIQRMLDGSMIRGRHLRVLELSRRNVPGDATHLGGDAHARSLSECLSIRTNAKAWAAALDSLVLAAHDSFASHRGRLLDSTETFPIHDALLSLPGAYDCEVAGATFRCALFVAAKGGAAEKRYRRLVKIFRGWLPAGWTFIEWVDQDVTSRTWLAQDALTGTSLTLALMGTRVYLLVR
jgi:hypothetical protein